MTICYDIIEKYIKHNFLIVLYLLTWFFIPKKIENLKYLLSPFNDFLVLFVDVNIEMENPSEVRTWIVTEQRRQVREISVGNFGEQSILPKYIHNQQLSTQNNLTNFKNPTGWIDDSQICKYINENTQKIYIYVEPHQNKVSPSVITQNENEYYCKYCQFGSCIKREIEHLKIIHKKLSDVEKDMYFKVWHWILAMSVSYETIYEKAFGDLVENKSIEDSKTRSKFSYIKDKGYGLLSIVIDVIIKGKLLILNPKLIYILKDENSGDVYNASWCKYCMGAQNIQCPAYKNLNEYFEPSIKYHDFGIQMCLPVTMSNKGLKIHSPPHITLGTHEVKKNANANFAKEYANDCPKEFGGPDYREIPFAKSFPVEIIDIHMNITKPSIQKIYNAKIKGSS